MENLKPIEEFKVKKYQFKLIKNTSNDELEIIVNHNIEKKSWSSNFTLNDIKRITDNMVLDIDTFIKVIKIVLLKNNNNYQTASHNNFCFIHNSRENPTKLIFPYGECNGNDEDKFYKMAFDTKVHNINNVDDNWENFQLIVKYGTDIRDYVFSIVLKENVCDETERLDKKTNYLNDKITKLKKSISHLDGFESSKSRNSSNSSYSFNMNIQPSIKFRIIALYIFFLFLLYVIIIDDVKKQNIKINDIYTKLNNDRKISRSYYSDNNKFLIDLRESYNSWIFKLEDKIEQYKLDNVINIHNKLNDFEKKLNKTLNKTLNNH
jgi:hypothetical protein